uniref:DUF2339 domain-containing protein n=1 Tax=Solibacter usitatus (strain Ellin6076) TaxID=234267 RepID=Q01US3_SOLUE
MSQPLSQPEWDALAHDVQDLRTRVARIELALGLAPSPEAPALSAASPVEPHPLETSTSLLPILGRTLLGLAGAYLLRALTESGTFSPRLGVAIGVCYAMAWLVWAARTPSARRLETALFGLTSVLVVSPLLYEAVASFHAISTWTAAGLLLAFTVFGFAVSWRKDVLIVATFATLAGLGTSAALLFATHDVLPFTYLFLAIAAAVEISACLDHWLSERWLTAAAADLAVLLATWLVTNERGLPDSYAPISHSALLGAQVALLAIYLSSIIVRTLLRGFTFTGFETTQCALAFVISVGGGLQLTTHNPRVAPAFAILAIACGAACYLVSFLMLDRDDTHTRNFYTYSTFALLLTVAGSRILLSGEAAAIAWGLLALAAIWAGGVFLRLSLKFHGCVFLVLALAGSSALAQALGLLLGNRTWPGGAQWAIWSGAITAALCYVLGTRKVASVIPSWSSRAWRILVGGTATLLVAGIAAGLLTSAYHLVFGEGASHAYCATLRTFVLAAVALLLAWSGARWNDRPEFGRLVYPVMALGAYRMIGVDLRQDRTAALFLSLLFYGAALMLLPRFTRSRL